MAVLDDYSDAGNCSSNSTGHSSHGGHSSPGTVLFLFASFAVGGELHFIQLSHAFAERAVLSLYYYYFSN